MELYRVDNNIGYLGMHEAKETYNLAVMRYITEDEHKLFSIMYNPYFTNKKNASIKDMHEKILKKRERHEYVHVVYVCKYRFNNRMYSQSPSLQNMNGKLREFLTPDYSEIDIINCYPTLLQHFFRSHKISCEQLDNYILHREMIIQKIASHKKKYNTHYSKMSGDKMKQVIKVMFIDMIKYEYINKSGTCCKEIIESDCGKCKLENIFMREIKCCYDILSKNMSNIFDHYEVEHILEKNDKKSTEKRKIISQLVVNMLNRWESRILDIIIDYMKTYRLIIDNEFCLLFDGIQFPHRSDMYKHVSIMEAEIKRLTGINIKLRYRYNKKTNI